MYFLCVCTYTLPSSPANDHLWGVPDPPCKIIQRATYLSKRTHFSILNIIHECVKHSSFYLPSHCTYTLPSSPTNGTSLLSHQ